MYNCHTGNGKYKPLLCGYLRGGSDTEIAVFPDTDPLGSVNFELSISGSVIIVTDPDPYSFLATLFINMI